MGMHIMCRGNNKQEIFLNNKDKLYYYSLLKKLKQENRITVFHYCLMSNHIHLVVWLNDKCNLSRFMKQVNLSYFYYYKRNYGYCGHFWQDRFKSNIVETDSYLLQCGKYIELNPVKAGIVSISASLYPAAGHGYRRPGRHG
jgi:putative transposase